MEAMRWLALAAALAMPGCAGTNVPTAGTQTVSLVLDQTSELVPAGQSSEIVARIRLGAALPKHVARPPVNVALVVDTSSSMEGEAIDDARRAVVAMLERLEEGDRVAVVGFSSVSEVLLPSTEIDAKSLRLARERVSRMTARGTTDLAGGLEAGIAQVMAGHDPRGVNRVVLLGDGVANVAGTARQAAQRAATSGVTITSLGLGDDYDEVLMGDLAATTGGRFHDVADVDEVASVFADEVVRLSTVAAKDARLTLTTGPGVGIADVVGLPMTRSGRDVFVTIGDLSQGDERDVFVTLQVDPHEDASPVELLDAVLTYRSATGDGTAMEQRGFISVRASGDSAEVARKDGALLAEAALARASHQTIRALELARAGNVIGARAMLQQGAEEALAAAEANGLPGLREQARQMRALLSDLPAPSPKPSHPAPAAGAGISEAEAAAPRSGAARNIRKAHAHARDNLMK